MVGLFILESDLPLVLKCWEWRDVIPYNVHTHLLLTIYCIFCPFVSFPSRLWTVALTVHPSLIPSPCHTQATPQWAPPSSTNHQQKHSAPRVPCPGEDTRRWGQVQWNLSVMDTVGPHEMPIGRFSCYRGETTAKYCLGSEMMFLLQMFL